MTLLASMCDAGLDERLASMVKLQSPLVIALVGGDARKRMEQARLFSQLAVGEASARVSSGMHPDVLVLGSDEPHGVDRVRRLTSHQLGYRPYEGERSICIFLDAGQLGIEASNVLLKTLEEGSKYLVVILSVNSRDDLLETIQSRAYCIHFGFVEEDMVPFPNALLSSMRSGMVSQLDVELEDVQLALEQMERGLYAWGVVTDDNRPDWMQDLPEEMSLGMMRLLLQALVDFDIGLPSSLVACALQVGMERMRR